MASKAGQPEAEKVDIEEALDYVDKTLDRTKVLYEQYFLGMQKQPPSQIHTDVERRLRELQQMSIRNTGLRYRFATLQQKFGSYNSYWRRTLKQIESGTYIRNLQKISRKAAMTGEAIPEEILAAMPKRMREQVKRDREQALAIAKRRNDTRDDEMAFLEEDEGAAIIGEAPEVVRQIARSGAQVLDESDGDLDFEAFFASVEKSDDTLENVLASKQPVAPQPRAAAAPVRPSAPVVRNDDDATSLQAPPSPRATGPLPVQQSRGTGAVPSGAPRTPGQPAAGTQPPQTAGVPPHSRGATQPAPGAPSGPPPPPPPARATGPVPRQSGPVPNVGEPRASGAIPTLAQTEAIPTLQTGAIPTLQTGAIPTVGQAGAIPTQPLQTTQQMPTQPLQTTQPMPTQPGSAQRPSGAIPMQPQRATQPMPTQPAQPPSGAAPAQPAQGQRATQPMPTQPAQPPSGAAPAQPAQGQRPSGPLPMQPQRATQPIPTQRAPIPAQPPQRPTPMSGQQRATGPVPLVPPPAGLAIDRAGVPASRTTGPVPVVPPATGAPLPRMAVPNIPRPLGAPSQTSKPNPIAPGSSTARPAVPVETMSGPFPRSPAPPVHARQEAPKVAPPKPPSAASRPPPGMNDADVNALYATYVKAKQAVGEEAGPGSYGKLLQTINAQAPKIMEQYKAKGVEFSVVVKNNQVVIKAKPKT